MVCRLNKKEKIGNFFYISILLFISPQNNENSFKNSNLLNINELIRISKQSTFIDNEFCVSYFFILQFFSISIHLFIYFQEYSNISS